MNNDNKEQRARAIEALDHPSSREAAEKWLRENPGVYVPDPDPDEVRRAPDFRRKDA